VATLFPLTFSNETLRRRISAIARESLHSAAARVVVLSHAKQRMRQRKVLLTQVYETLIKGVVVEPAHRDIKGCWKCTLRHVSSGDEIKVVAALCQDPDGEVVVVITVMN